MTDEELTKITDSMQDKLGTDNSALIADDIAAIDARNDMYWNTPAPGRSKALSNQSKR